MPNVLVIAASDPSGGAGMEADVKTLSAHGVNALTALTALTVQTSRGVISVHPTSVRTFQKTLRALEDDQAIAAIKIGALATAGHVKAVRDFLGRLQPLPPVVLDPVIWASSGPELLSPETARDVLPSLFPFLTLLTPNLSEAEILVGKPVRNLSDMEKAAKELGQQGITGVLIKGGHLRKNSVDVLCFQGQITKWRNRKLPGEFHGTGCALASAIAARLAKGHDLVSAVSLAREYLATCMALARPGKGAAFLLAFPPAPQKK